MNDKIAVFYSIAQVHDWWATEFFEKQINRLITSGLYDNIDFIDIAIGHNHLPLPFIPNKVRNITYGKEYLDNSKEYHKRIWEFCSNNPGYKILQFHSLGVSWQNYHKEEKSTFRNYLETLLIDNWEKCTLLLDYYDCVGTDLMPQAIFYNGYDPDDLENEDKWTRFDAPHFQGGYWWATSDYISSLSLEYLDQPVHYKRYLPELWVGSNSPKIYNFYTSWKNQYIEFVDPPYENIFSHYNNTINKLQNN